MWKRCGILFSAIVIILLSASVAFSVEDKQEEETYTVSGVLTGPDASHLRGVTVRLHGDGIDKSTDTLGSGEYSFIDIPNGSYTVTPEAEGHYFVPGSVDIVVNGLDVTIDNFEALHGDGTFYDLTVLVVDSNGSPMQDVEVTLTGNGENLSDLSYKDGTVTFEELANTLSYEVSVALDEWKFDPEILTVTINGSDAETDPIVGTRDVVGYTVSGRIVVQDGNGLEGADLELKCVTGKDVFETTSNADGSYSFEEVPENSYIIVPMHDDYTFEPEASELMVDRADFTIDDIVATKK